MFAGEDSIVSMPIYQGILKKRKDKIVSFFVLMILQMVCLLYFLEHLLELKLSTISAFRLFVQRNESWFFFPVCFVLLIILEAEVGYLLVQTSQRNPFLLQHKTWKHCKYLCHISAFTCSNEFVMNSSFSVLRICLFNVLHLTQRQKAWECVGKLVQCVVAFETSLLFQFSSSDFRL